MSLPSNTHPPLHADIPPRDHQPLHYTLTKPMARTPPLTSSLSRTSSAASISSEDGSSNPSSNNERRTRKRFSNVQLMMLEQLFHQTSHPTREEREEVAKAAGMEIKSVTIWFQNKRQTERKVALHNATNSSNTINHSSPFPTRISRTNSAVHSTPSASTPVRSSLSQTTPRPNHLRSHTRTLSTPSRTHAPLRTPSRSRPSLDRIATRSELRPPPTRTRAHTPDPHATLWDNMPSSPLAPPASPPARELVEFGLGLGEGKGGRRTLEWACAAARLADKEKGVSVNRPNRKKSSHGDDEDTEDDSEEAITPDSSFGADSQFGLRPRNAHTSIRKLGSLQFTREESKSKEAAEDEDVMRAALALCGLGRRSGLTQ